MAELEVRGLEFGVEVNGKYVDTVYNGGFRDADDAKFAAGHGYVAGTKAVPMQRKVYVGPWEPIPE